MFWGARAVFAGYLYSYGHQAKRDNSGIKTRTKRAHLWMVFQSWSRRTATQTVRNSETRALREWENQKTPILGILRTGKRAFYANFTQSSAGAAISAHIFAEFVRKPAKKRAKSTQFCPDLSRLVPVTI